ncbi:hypothetical protein Taro_012393 [Colocasia esculenta]|uniref:Uncharacterized protein n=1 Tax=Colocasia esculenta TaxID=4460 RepID=A0A843U8Y7_COLES|nr:hypothetical protein [Colocasia esculenta]
MVFKYPYSRALNASILSKTLWVCAFRCTCFPRPSSKTPEWVNVVLICICFLKGTLPKRRFCPRTYSYNHNLVLMCICFLKETLFKRRFCPKTYSYVHNIVLICIYFLKETLPNRRFCRKHVKTDVKMTSRAFNPM